MRSAALRGGGRPLAALMPLIAAAAILVLPAPPGTLTAGLFAALLTIVVAVAVGSVRLAPVGFHAGSRTRAVLERMVPRTAQSDPDARGHARPRAPGAGFPAV